MKLDLKRKLNFQLSKVSKQYRFGATLGSRNQIIWPAWPIKQAQKFQVGFETDGAVKD
jgi:hypothetical protein